MRISSFSVLALFVAACGNGDPHDEELVLVVDEPEGETCAYGGTAIHTGVDSNNDGELGAQEVTSTSYVCNASRAVKCAEGGINMPGPVTLTDAADFAALAGVNCIDGDLLILATTFVTLPPLPDLTTVTGSVIVAANASLGDLDGLSSMRDVGRKYVVQGNDALVDVGGLGGLQRWETISILGNDALLNLVGLELFENIEGHIEISNNSALTSLQGLENLHAAKGLLNIRSNKQLASTDALGQLRSVGQLDLVGNPALTTLAFPALEKTNNFITVKDNAALASLSLPTLFTSGGLVVQQNPSLTSVSAPELVLTLVVHFENDISLTTLTLPKLAYNTAYLWLWNMPDLTQVSFPSLLAIGGTLHLMGLPDLTALSGFSGVQSLGGDLVVNTCNGLVDFTGLSNLIDVGNMTISQNAQLSSFAGLTTFEKVSGNLLISSNPSLPQPTAQAFANSITVAGTVTIN